MTSITSKIVDWTGAFHDLTKGSFDSTFFTDPDQPAKIEASYVKDAFGKIWENLGGSQLLENVEIASFVQRAGAVVAGAGLSTVTTETAGIVSGPVGAAVALGVEELVRALAGSFQADTRTTYDEGEWVMYDRGSKELTRKVQREENFMLAFGFGGEMGGADVKEHFLDDYGLGFFIEGIDGTKDVRIFDYGKGHPITVHPNLVMALPDTKKKEFDHNEDLSKVREIWFADELGLTLNSNVPTDPGSEVIFEGTPYTMVKAHGTRATIEDPSNGENKEVDLADLKGGRTVHDKSWKRPMGEAQCREREAVLIPGLSRRRMPGTNCENGVKDGFDAFGAGDKKGEATLHAKTFAWFSPSRKTPDLEISRELAVITHLEDSARIVHFWFLFDMEQQYKNSRDRFTPLSRPEKEFAMSNKRLRQILEKALSGNLGKSYAIGGDLGGIVYALNFDKQAVAKSLEKYKKAADLEEESPILPVPRLEPVSLGEVGDRNLAKAKDGLEEDLRYGAATASHVRDTRQKPAHEKDAESNSSMMFVGLAAAAIAVVYFSTR